MQIFGLATHGQLRPPRPYCRGNQRRPVDLICASAVDTVPVHSWSGAIMLPTPPISPPGEISLKRPCLVLPKALWCCAARRTLIGRNRAHRVHSLSVSLA
jgi:hypothetical protein